MAWGTVGYSCLYLIPCVNALIYKAFSRCIKYNDAAGNEVYRNEFLTFKDDYDTVNPLSKKNGQLRLLQQKILQAEGMANPD
jgi:hypothetical protein